MPADLADNAAAVAEGYVRVQIDRGAGFTPRYATRYEKPFDRDLQSGGLRQISGFDASSQANADAQALASLNGFRRPLYGTDATNVNKVAEVRQHVGRRETLMAKPPVPPHIPTDDESNAMLIEKIAADGTCEVFNSDNGQRTVCRLGVASISGQLTIVAVGPVPARAVVSGE